MPQAAGFDCDVAVVGSGIAGALIGRKLAQAGVKVIILEAGPTVDRANGLAPALATIDTALPEATYAKHPWAPTLSWLAANTYYVQT